MTTMSALLCSGKLRSEQLGDGSSFRVQLRASKWASYRCGGASGPCSNDSQGISPLHGLKTVKSTCETCVASPRPRMGGPVAGRNQVP